MIDNQNTEYLSESQTIVLAILPIPSAILSILGSLTIIYVACESRVERKWTPYTRLLIGLSVSDIFFSICVSIGNLLRPRETSLRAWAFGNEATCDAMGFFNQFSYSAIFYNAMLSFYFLLTARFGLKNSYIAKCIEPIMHFISLGFPLVTAFVGSILGVYDEPSTGMGCWVNNYPKNCGDGPGKSGEQCLSPLIGWIYFGLPFLLVLACLIVNNVVIWLFVRKQISPTRPSLIKKSTKSTDSDELSNASEDDEEDSVPFSEPDKTIFGSARYSAQDGTVRHAAQDDQFKQTPKQASIIRKEQHRRLKLVSTQTFLFVASFLICNIWSGLMALAESSAKSDEDEQRMLVTIYPICVAQAALLPLQGLFNMLVYIRPKYLKWRHEYPKESKRWAARRAILGQKVKSTMDPHNNEEKPDDKQEKSATTAKLDLFVFNGNEKDIESGGNDDPDTDMRDTPVTHHSWLPRRDMISSLSASEGDFDSIVEEEDNSKSREDNDQGKASNWVPIPKSSRIRRSSLKLSSLEVISETSESVFEETTAVNSLDSETNQIKVRQDRRWSSSSRRSTVTPAPDRNSLTLVSPVESESRWSSSFRKSEPAHQELHVSLPLSMPRRTESTNASINGSLSESLSDISTDSQPLPPVRKNSPDPSRVYFPEAKEGDTEDDDSSSSEFSKEDKTTSIPTIALDW